MSCASWFSVPHTDGLRQENNHVPQEVVLWNVLLKNMVVVDIEARLPDVIQGQKNKLSI